MKRSYSNISPNQQGYKLPAQLMPKVTIVNGAEPECPHCAGTGFEVVVTWRGKNLQGEPAELTDLIPCRCRTKKCKVCGGRGLVRADLPVGDPDFGKMRLCPMNCEAAHKISAARAQGALHYSQLPSKYADLTFATFDNLPMRDTHGKMPARLAAEAFARSILSGHNGYVNRADIATMIGREAPEDWRNWLCLYGEHGRGKTGLAAAVVNALAAAGQTCMYIRLGDFIEAVQKRYDAERRREGFGDEFGKTAEDVLTEVKTASVLICDEFDVADLTTNKRALVEKLIRFRHGAELPTVITTNLDPEGFDRRWERTISSVVWDRAHWIPVKGESLRRDAAAYEWE